MALESRPNRNGYALVECPLEDCRADLSDSKACCHIAKHSPTEFGLSPLRGNVATDGGERE